MSDLEPGVQLTPDTIAAMERLSTPLPKPPMTNQHQATPDEWAQQEDWANRSVTSSSSCIIELRDRVEALEIARLITHGITAEEVAPSSPALNPVLLVATDAELCQVYNDAPEHRFGPALRAVYDLGREHAAAPTRPGPAGSAPDTDARQLTLVERVTDGLPCQDACQARAALRVVADAALQMHPDKNLTWERVALWLEQEASRG